IALLFDKAKTPIMVEVEVLFFLLSTTMGAYQMRCELLYFSGMKRAAPPKDGDSRFTLTFQLFFSKPTDAV
ncbi:hypothetical protein, partial [Paenibacillus sp. FSL H8-0548]|uniref:hypothetical protein n=1 Tax=Paenibacillus sp. FSL H8-0548 TaxID=1920422 RepID=UPI001C4CD709